MSSFRSRRVERGNMRGTRESPSTREWRYVSAQQVIFARDRMFSWAERKTVVVYISDGKREEDVKRRGNEGLTFGSYSKFRVAIKIALLPCKLFIYATARKYRRDIKWFLCLLMKNPSLPVPHHSQLKWFWTSECVDETRKCQHWFKWRALARFILFILVFFSFLVWGVFLSYFEIGRSWKWEDLCWAENLFARILSIN